MKNFPLLICLLACLMASAQPRLDHHGDYARIVANDYPMLIIGGELGNSSASTSADIHDSMVKAHALGLNTVLVPLSWHLIEPQEGNFDFSTLASILEQARNNDLKVALLWFGAWKNSMSCYAPEWFKTDTERFPRAHTAAGKPVEEASSLSTNVLDADMRALKAVMAYLRDNDSEQTVIMLQVENEIGMIESPRDYSPEANALYASNVPDELLDYLREHHDQLHPYLQERLQHNLSQDSWANIFGNDIYGEEIFQAWTYAKYVGQLAKAAKKVFDIPMFVNVALDSRDRKPGQYPSAGPLAQLIDIWHCGAPDIDVMGVDIYDRGFADWAAKYHLPNNPLFIPEIRLDDSDAMKALYAFGHHDAMGFCPFSIEDYPLTKASTSSDWSSVDVNADDQINAYSHMANRLSPIAAAYRLLRQAEPLIIERQGSDDMDAVLLDNEHREQEIITPDSVRITIKHSLSLGWEPVPADDIWPEAACLILRVDPMEYIVLGSNVVLTFSPAQSGKAWKVGDDCIGIASCEEIEIHDGQIAIVRHLSGDQTHQGRHVRIPASQTAMQRFRLYRYR